jgi:cellulose synthase/poly-beta-1,6-N-acetylglucosamine synthase-like glycosyltransferase
LIERRPSRPDPSGSAAHGAGLDLGLANCRTEFFVSLHSDTVILKTGWLSYLLERFADDPQIACVGTGKLELKPRWQRWLAKATDVKAVKRRFMADPEERLRFRYFNTTICSAYRTEVLRRERLSFSRDAQRHLTVGRELYFTLVDRGYQTVAIPNRDMGQYVAHLAHATQAIHNQQFAITDRAARRYLRRAQKVLQRQTVQSLLSDSSLDA